MTEDDGVALQATEHPIEVTAEMLDAGEAAFEAMWQPGKTPRDMVNAVFVAMARATQPWPDDISEDALETVEIAIPLPVLPDDVSDALSATITPVNVQRGATLAKLPDNDTRAVIEVTLVGGSTESVLHAVSENELATMDPDVMGLPVCYHFNRERDPSILKLWPRPDQRIKLEVRRVLPANPH